MNIFLLKKCFVNTSQLWRMIKLECEITYVFGLNALEWKYIGIKLHNTTERASCAGKSTIYCVKRKTSIKTVNN